MASGLRTSAILGFTLETVIFKMYSTPSANRVNLELVWIPMITEVPVVGLLGYWKDRMKRMDYQSMDKSIMGPAREARKAQRLCFLSLLNHSAPVYGSIIGRGLTFVL